MPVPDDVPVLSFSPRLRCEHLGNNVRPNWEDRVAVSLFRSPKDLGSIARIPLVAIGTDKDYIMLKRVSFSFGRSPR
jgi:hypothetical protein